jgi:tetratricopeptide (TPR) repeat protein
MRQLLLITLAGATLLAAPPEYKRALHFYNCTEYDASLQLLLQVRQPDSATVLLIGQNYFMMGDANRAAEFFQQAVSAEPNNSVHYHWLGRAYARQAELAGMFNALGLATKSRQNLEKALELDHKNIEAANDLFEFYLEAPKFMGGGMGKAEHLAVQIAELDAAEGQYSQSQIDEKKKDFVQAEIHLRRAMELAPRQVGRVIDVAKFLAKQGRFEESEKTFQAAEKIEPHAPKILYARAEAYIEAHRNIDVAKNLLEKYLSAQLTPDDPPRSDARKLLLKVSGG